MDSSSYRAPFQNVYQGKKVLVTGHTGFKGSWLTLWLKRLGAEVSGVSLYIPSTPSHYVAAGIDQDGKSFELDIRQGEALRRVFEEVQPEIVFHLAANPLVQSCYADPKGAFETNLGGTIHVLEAMRTTKSVQAAVLITSDKCYENVEWEYGYRETDRLGGKDPYSASKACAEIAISTYVRSFFTPPHTHVPMASVRAGNVIGGGDWAQGRIVPDMIRAWSADKPLCLRAPDATRPWQHVLEPLSGYLWLGAQLITRPQGEGLGGEAFNFGPQPQVNQSVLHVVEALSAYWPHGSWQLDPAAYAHKPEAGLLKLCCDKALQRLGWQALLSFQETMDMTAQWYRAFYEGESMRVCSSKQLAYYEALAQERHAAWR